MIIEDGPATLPNAVQAYVEEKKITGYLLSDTHPQGRSKAVFFRAFGFVPAQWQELAAALVAQGAAGTVVSTLVRPDSTQYAVEGELSALDGRAPRIRTVWEVRPEDARPRLITAYPRSERAWT